MTPSERCVSPGRGTSVTCYNISTTRELPTNSLWYKITSNGTLQQLSTDINDRAISDGNQLRISSAINEDNGTYCCKGLTQALHTCDESATAKVLVVVPPVIIPGQNQIALVRNNAAIECIIEQFGNPPPVVFRWQKSQRRLVTDGTKYTSQLIGNRMFLTIINSTTNDEGHYWCILETSCFHRKQASVYLTVNHTQVTTTRSSNGALYSNYLYD